MGTLLEIGTYVDAQNVAVLDTDLFLGKMPDEPDTVVVIYQYPGGGGPEYVQESNSPLYETPQIQVVARAKRYATAETKINQMWSLLSGVTNAVLSGTKYRSIRPNGSPGIIGRDTNDRVLLAFNATVDKEVILETVS